MGLDDLKRYIEEHPEMPIQIDFRGQRYAPKGVYPKSLVWFGEAEKLNYAIPFETSRIDVDSFGRPIRVRVKTIAKGVLKDGPSNAVSFDEDGKPTLHARGDRTTQYLDPGKAGYDFYSSKLWL